MPIITFRRYLSTDLPTKFRLHFVKTVVQQWLQNHTDIRLGMALVTAYQACATTDQRFCKASVLLAWYKPVTGFCQHENRRFVSCIPLSGHVSGRPV